MNVVTPVTGPFRYLDHFREHDQRTFAGREDDIAEVVAAATSDDPFVLYARSGLGKTSLLLAGVFPALRERGLRPVYVRVQDDATLELRNAVAAELKLECAEQSQDLLELVRRASLSAGLVLVFDQFEEFFINTRSDPRGRLAFGQLLGRIANDEQTDLRLTFSLREDYLAELDDLRGVFPTILANQYRLRPLTAFGARQAIVTPLIEARIPFDQQLVVRLVDLLASVEFDTALLQIACGEVYREAVARDENVRLVEQDLDQIGGVEGLFERLLANAIATIPRNQLLLSRAVLDALVTPEDTKRQVVFEALLSNEDFQGSREEIESVLGCLKHQKVVRSDLRRGAIWYELSHDRLVPSVVKWFKRDSDFSQFRNARDLIAEHSRRAAFPERLETLLSAPQIEKLIGPYRDRIKLNDAQRALLFWSAVHARVSDVSYWADRFGQSGCCNALLALLAHSSAEARLGAAAAVERMTAQMPGLAENCLTVALEDDNADVRRAAAKAVAKIGSAEQIDALNSALGNRHKRWRALDVLAEFVQAGKPIDAFQIWWRYAARHRARHRVLDDSRSAIDARGKRGALIGLVTAIGWMATIGAVVICAAMWIVGETRWVWNAFLYASSTAAILGIIGLVYGWLIGRSGARVAATKGSEDRWADALLQPLPLLAGFITLPVICAVLLKIFRPAVWPPTAENFRTRAAWSLLLGLPIGLPFLGLAVLVGEFEFWTFMRMALIVSCLPVIAASVLSESAITLPIGNFPPSSRVWQVGARSALLLAALSIPFGFIWQFGRDSTPFGRGLLSITDAHEIPLNFGSTMDSTYFRLASAPEDVKWVSVKYPHGVKIRARSGIDLEGYYSTEMHDVLFIPQGRHLISAFSPRPSGKGTLTLTPLRVLKDDTTVEASTKAWTVYVLRLKHSPSEGESKGLEWRGEARPRLAIGSVTRGMTIRVLPLSGRGVPNGELVRTNHYDFAQASQAPVAYGMSTSLDAATVAISTAGELPNEMRPVLIGDDGGFRLDLTYRLKGNSQDVNTSPIDIPIAIALKEANALEEYALGTARTSDFISFLRDNQSVWNDASQLDELGRKAAALEKHDESIQLRQRVLALQPDNPEALNSLAWGYVIADQGPAALPLARKAIERSKGREAHILDTAAHAEYLTGNWRQAADDWEAVLRLDPGHYKPLRDRECFADYELMADAWRKAGLPKKSGIPPR